MKGRDPILLAEDDRLEELNAQTERWWYEMRSRMTVDSVHSHQFHTVIAKREDSEQDERSRIFTYSETCAIIDFEPMGGSSRATILRDNGGKFRCENKNPELTLCLLRLCLGIFR